MIGREVQIAVHERDPVTLFLELDLRAGVLRKACATPLGGEIYPYLDRVLLLIPGEAADGLVGEAVVPRAGGVRLHHHRGNGVAARDDRHERLPAVGRADGGELIGLRVEGGGPERRLAAEAVAVVATADHVVGAAEDEDVARRPMVVRWLGPGRRGAGGDPRDRAKGRREDAGRRVRSLEEDHGVAKAEGHPWRVGAAELAALREHEQGVVDAN